MSTAIVFSREFTNFAHQGYAREMMERAIPPLSHTYIYIIKGSFQSGKFRLQLQQAQRLPIPTHDAQNINLAYHIRKKKQLQTTRMKKFLLCGALAAGCCLASTAQSKINNVGRLQLMNYAEEQARAINSSASRAAAVIPTATVFVTLSAGSSAADIEAAGYDVIDTAADMAIVALPIDKVEELAANDFVKYIDFSQQVSPLMDIAREMSSVTPVHNGGEGLDRAYKGKGVYVGLYDTGLDPAHINFTDHDGNTRVKSIYLVKNGAVSRYESDDDIKSFSTDTESESHGTHVLGIMAGREDVPGKYGIREGNSVVVKDGAIPYYGVAPEASLIVGCGSFDNTSINAGIGAVIDRAKRDGKPVVVNLSLGHNRGSHDPRETSNKYLDTKAQDAIIVVAAGNEGGSNMSVEKTLRGSGGRNLQLNTFVVPDGTSMAQAWYTAEFWSDNDQSFSCTLVLYNTATNTIAASLPLTGESGNRTWRPSDNAVFASAYTSSSRIAVSWGKDNATGRYNVQLDNDLQSNGSAPIVFGVNITGKNGQRINGYCDAYTGYSQAEVVFSNQGVSGYMDGTDKGSINGLACGYNTISVGAWVSRTSMPTLAGNSTSYDAGGVGKIAGFSSYGSSGDGRQLPIVCAPGAQIISSVSKYWVAKTGLAQNRLNAFSDANGRENPWYYMQGTSMACPFASGTIALWLEACPGLRANEVKQIIEKTSTKDANTVPTNRWGAGKINALAGLKEAIVMSASVESTLVDNADQNLMVVAKGGKQFEVSCPGVNNLSCSLYNLQGAAVASADDAGDTIDLDASSLQEGIYVLSVNAGGQKLSRKLVVK